MRTTPSLWPDVEVRSLHGIPTIHREGKPWFGWGANRPIYGDHYEIYERLAGCGFRQFHIDATCSEDIYHPELRFWQGPGEFDPSAHDRHFRRVAEICPDALLQLRIYAGAPPWWVEAHPEHCQVYADGSSEREIQRGGVRRLPSLASPLWRTEINEALRRYIGWLEESGWSKRVSALFICYGITWEWAILGSDGLPDYSVHARDYFRQWLRARYGTEAKLSAAWGRHVEFETVEIPDARRRSRSGGENGLRRVPSEQDVIDHQQCLSDMNADLLLSLASTARQSTRGEALIGSFYGYTLTAREQTPFTGLYGAGGFVGGHHALGRVLRSPDIDFLASPFNYLNRDLGTGLLYEHLPLASLHAHGKVFFDENDLYTFTNQPNQDDRMSQLSVGVTTTRENTIKMFQSAFAQAVVRGKHQWLTELTGWIGDFRENFSDEALLIEISRLNAMADELIARDRGSVAEIAFVLDEASVAHLTLDNKDFLHRVYEASLWWGHTGAPFDLILLEDLLEKSPGAYKLIIPACVRRPGALEQLQRHIVAAGKAIVVDSATDLLAEMARADVHRYVEDSSTVWANASMVFVHVHGAGQRLIRLRKSCRGKEVLSRRQFVTDQIGVLPWEFEENGSALFVYDL